jgi:hypothetical protein
MRTMGFASVRLELSHAIRIGVASVLIIKRVDNIEMAQSTNMRTMEFASVRLEIKT